MSRYDMWTHGVNVAVEHPSRLVEQRRQGFGALFAQSAETDNWFHFAIPTPTVMGSDESVDLRYLRLRATADGAAVMQAAVHEDGSNRILDRVLNAQGAIDHRIELLKAGKVAKRVKKNVNGAIALSIRVEFKGRSVGGLSTIRFLGAGARFDS